MKLFDQIASRENARKQTVFNLFMALSLACKNANTAKDNGVISACIRRADEIRSRLVSMGELPETSR